jgi:DNA modification methylase/rubredoxin
MEEILAQWQEERRQIREKLGLPDDAENHYHREPFAADVSEGKNDPIYNAHSYHTKVPHKAIMRYILHYTEPGDIVLDGFCGTGMTGVAAQLCGDKKTVESLGYRVDDQGIIWEGDKPISRLGGRKAVLIDLSPAATFIAYNYNTPADARAFEREARRILREVEQECGWMYETWHPHCDAPDRVKGKINYTVWSDVFLCPQCGAEMVFWDVAVDHENGQIRDDWHCPGCDALLSKSPRKGSRALRVERAFETKYDRAIGQTVRQAKQVPVRINYSVGKKRYEKRPDAADLALLEKIENSDIPYLFPTYRMPDGDESRRNDEIGLTHVHHFYTRRNLWALAAIFSRIKRFYDKRIYNFLALWFTSQLINISILNRFRPNVSFPYNPLSGTLYVSSQVSEADPFSSYCNRIKRISYALIEINNFSVSGFISQTNDSSKVLASATSIDYIFVDPPFGANLMYSELNFLWEAWLGVFTNNAPEAVINKAQRKGLPEYQALMEACFREFYRVLKPGRWMTVEFHNSQNAVWNAIQEALLRAGFVIADVRTLDKQQGTFKQVTTTSAVKQDLIISAYKPTAVFEQQFALKAGTVEGAWEFVRHHLAKLPVVVWREGLLEPIAERQPYLLFDRMVAFHIQRGLSVPLSAAEFYEGLKHHFIERDSMIFLPEQVPEYDRARLQAQGVAQLTWIVSDEKSAIQWLRQQLDPHLGGYPQTYQEIQPKFLKQLHQVRYEALPELADLLEQNFLQDEAGRWFVPDPAKASDLEALRQKVLLREFKSYLESNKRLRQFRLEAVRAGFAEAYRRRDWATIRKVAERLPEQALQEDSVLLMYYDAACLRAE